MNGAVAVVLGRKSGTSVAIQVISAPPEAKQRWGENWWRNQYFDGHNCVKIGHIEIPDDGDCL